MKIYESSLKNKRDAESVRLTAIKQGLREGMEKGLEQGLKQGLEKGRKEERAKAEAEKWETAREMKKDGLSVEQIAKFTKLSVTEIEKLK